MRPRSKPAITARGGVDGIPVGRRLPGAGAGRGLPARRNGLPARRGSGTACLGAGLFLSQQELVKHLFAQTGNLRHHRRGAFGGKLLCEALQERCGVGVEVVLPAGAATDDQDDLAAPLVGIGADKLLQLAQGGTADGFERLGELAGENGFALGAEGRDHGCKAFGQPVGRLVEDKGDGCRGQFCEAVGAGAGLRRQEALEQEAVGGQARCTEGGNGGTGARHGHDGKAQLLDVAHQAVTGIGYERGPGVGNQGHAAARGQASTQSVEDAAVAVIVVGDHRRFDCEMVQQALAVPGILRGDERCTAQYLDRPVGDIPQISDRRGHDIEPGIHFSPYNAPNQDRKKHTMPLKFPTHQAGRLLASAMFLAALSLWGCSTPPPPPPQAPVELPVEPPQPVATRPGLDLPASDFATPFTTAEHQLIRFDWMGAEQTLAGIPQEQLTLDDAARLAYLRAGITFVRGDTQQALYALQALDHPGVHPALRYRALNLRRHIEGLAGNHLESARLGQLLMPLAPEPEQAALRQAIWLDLLRADSDELQRALASEYDPVRRGWLELALLERDPQAGAAELSLWRDANPRHPAAEALPGGLAYRTGHSQGLQPIALLLPLSGRLAPAGKAVRDGYLASYYASGAAAFRDQELLVLDQDSYDSVTAAYDDAVLRGAGLVVGPLTRQSVNQLAGLADRPVPVLALNRGATATPGNSPMLQLSLAPEDEAARIAELAFGQGARRALVIRPSSGWGEKMEQALEARWSALGGTIANRVAYGEQADYSNDVKAAFDIPASERRAREVRDMLATNVEFNARRRQDVDAIFLLAGSGAEARSLKPLLAFHYAGSVPVYATSSIYSGITDPRDRDLNGVKLVEIPWLLGSSPGLRVAIAAGDTGSDAYTRLNALGADAFLLQHYFGALQEAPDLLIRGNTGLLSMDADGRIRRELSAATFDGGVLKPL